MKWSRMLKMAMVGLVSGLLLGTVVQGRAERKLQNGDVARGKALFCQALHRLSWA